ncbi:hypothetical protein MTO96_014600 [Rhipicephalus appendiculatus]
MENEETTLVGQRESQPAVDLGDPFINSALVHTASACLIFVVVFIFVLPGILLTTLRREKPYQVDMRPKTRLSRQAYDGPDRPLIMCMVNSTSFQRPPAYDLHIRTGSFELVLARRVPTVRLRRLVR